MSSQPITMLSGLTTAELTLTKRGANNRRFAVTKGDIPMDLEILQAIVGTPADGEDKFLATLKSQGITEGEKISAAVAQFRIQKGMRDLIDDDTMASVAKAAGYEIAKAKKEEEDDDDDKKKPFPGAANPFGKKKKAKKSLDLNSLDDNTRAQVEAVFKSHEEIAEKSAKLESVVKSLQDNAREKEYVAKAANEYGHIPMSDEDLGVMLKSANDASPEFAKNFEALLGRMNEAVHKSGLLTTAGAVHRDQSSGAWGKIEALAKGMVQKSVDGGSALSHDQARDLVMKSEVGAELYREYLGENPKQRGEIY